jgi:hypothetical protein
MDELYGVEVLEGLSKISLAIWTGQFNQLELSAHFIRAGCSDEKTRF